MALVANTVPNPTMKRIDIHNRPLMRKAFYNRKAFLTFVYSPNPNTMSTYFPSRGREFHYGVIFFLFLLPFPHIAQEQHDSSIFKKYLKQAREDTLSIQARKKALMIAYSDLKPTPADSIKYAHLSKLVEVAAHLKDSILFLQVAKEGYNLAKQLNRPAHLGDAHWNYGSYYERQKNYDSSYVHYNKAYKYFLAAKNEYYAGKMLYNMAYISGQTNDYTGAEILLFRCIIIFEKFNKHLQLYRCYNLLGNHADDMEEFDKSFKYYQEASSFIPNLENKAYYRLEHWNNLGVRLYKMQLFSEAIPYFKKALAQSDILKTKPGLYAKILDNLAYCEVSLGKNTNVLQPMKLALSIRDSIGDSAGVVISRLRFANYYAKVGDSLNAIRHATEGFEKAKENHFTPMVLHALETLASLDTKNAVQYLQHHVQQNKKLNSRDRNLRNKFTAVQYETEKYIAENEKLFQHRLWISIGAITTTLILLLIYRNTRQSAKNKALVFEREQQQLNEDLILMALEQKNNLEKGRKIERLRISRDLHDSVISKILSIRLRLEEVFYSREKTQPNIEERHIKQMEEVETEIRNISHDLRSKSLWQDHDFLEILEETIKAKSEIAAFEYAIHKQNSEVWEDLDDLSKMHIARMLEEILQNIYKHAHARLVTASFETSNGNLFITINDNGKGFHPKKGKKGIGLKNLRYRTDQLNGTLNISSSPGQGTSVQITIPFNT